MPRLRAIPLLALATSLFVLPVAFAQNTNTARPGTINYVEGQATLNGQPLSTNSRADVAQGRTIATQNDKVEVLLTPGVFLRLGDNTAVTMVSPDLTRTEVQVDRGIAEVEVDQLYKQNDLLVDQGPAQTTLLKDGLYEFDATTGRMRVFDGEAAVSLSQSDKKWIKVKGHHEVAVNGEPAKSQNFDGEQAANQDPIYNWSKLRADDLGQANLSLAQEYAGNPGFYPGWMWDPALYAYTWLPGDGLFWGPFGDGFYSPWYLYGGGFIYPAYGFGGHYYRGGFGYRGPYRDRGTVGAVRGAPAAHAYAGPGGFRGGSGGSGFHGGGGGGGFHGGGGGSHGGGGGRR
jgi:hypothetical protein